MAATREDLVNLNETQKHRSRRYRQFAMTNTGFDGASVREPVENPAKKKNTAASRKLLEEFVW